jgi:hypothetical protein
MPDTTNPQADPLAVARATNQRLNARAQRLESELAAYRRAVAQWEISDQMTYVPLRSLAVIAKAAGLAVPERWELHYERVERLEAAAVPVPAPTDRAVRAQRYGQALRRWGLLDEVNNPKDAEDFAVVDLLAIADAEQAELRRERDLAIAHDRQPYPTAWAYEQACAALNRKTEQIERVRSVLESEAVVGRNALDYRGLITSALMVDAAPVSGPGGAADETQAHPPVTEYRLEFFDADMWNPISQKRQTLDEVRATRDIFRRGYPDARLRIVRWDETSTVVESDEQPAVEDPTP